MRRIGLAVALTLSLVLVPLAVAAQPPGKAVYRVGLIFTTSPVTEMAGPQPVHPFARAFVDGLRDLGYVEGQNLILDRRSAEGRFERFGDIVAELVRLKADVIVTVSDRMARAAKAVTATTPIVMAVTTDPVGNGVVQSLARPGGNITGLTYVAGLDLEAKGLEILKDALPRARRVAYLGGSADWDSPAGKSFRAAAQVLGVTVILAEPAPNEYTGAFATISRARPDALFVTGYGPNFAYRGLIVDFATRSRLPSAYVAREFGEAGGLMSYGVNISDLYRRAAMYVDKILHGAKPADLPVEQPTKFELVINLKTAKALGLTIPPSVLLRADRVIE
jgi:putative ABC transport system substrate-binding protein